MDFYIKDSEGNYLPGNDGVIFAIIDNLDKIERIINKAPIDYGSHKDFIEEELKKVLFDIDEE